MVLNQRAEPVYMSLVGSQHFPSIQKRWVKIWNGFRQ
nr:MAG TPA: hypothetical protein [Caudoviricetes sp.]